MLNNGHLRVSLKAQMESNMTISATMGNAPRKLWKKTMNKLSTTLYTMRVNVQIRDIAYVGMALQQLMTPSSQELLHHPTLRQCIVKKGRRRNGWSDKYNITAIPHRREKGMRGNRAKKRIYKIYKWYLLINKQYGASLESRPRRLSPHYELPLSLLVPEELAIEELFLAPNWSRFRTQSNPSAISWRVSSWCARAIVSLTSKLSIRLHETSIGIGVITDWPLQRKWSLPSDDKLKA